MRSAVFLAALAAPVLGQSINTTFVAGLLQFLEAANLTALAAVAQGIANTTTGERILADISNGTWTIFAPNNQAFAGVPKNISSNPDLLADVLSYHVVPGTVNASDFFNNSDTIVRTLFNDSSRSFLEGGLPQVLALRTEAGNITHVLNQNTPTTIVQSTTVGNLTVHIVDSVIDLPGNLTQAAAANNLTGAAAALEQAKLLTPLETQHGITIFAPNDAAFNTALTAFGSTPPNASVLAVVLANHVINGSTVYSSELFSTNTVSAAGEKFNFTVNTTGYYVQSGNVQGKILVPDIILNNGVLHIIDTVLLNTANDTSAASSAFSSAISSASAEATATTTATTPVLGTPAPGGVSGNGSSSGNSGGSSSGSGSSGSSGSGSKSSALSIQSLEGLDKIALASVAFVAGLFVL